MTAVRATFGGFPRPRSWRYFARMRLRNVNAYYGGIGHLFLLLCLFSSPHARVSIQAVGKDGGDQTPLRPLFGQAARGPTTATPGAPNRGAARGWTFRGRSTAVKLTNKRLPKPRACFRGI